LSSVARDSIISTEIDLSFITSSAQVGRIDIEATADGGYFVKTDVALNKVTTGAINNGTAQVEDKEWLVVSGLQVNGFKYQFIETALHDIDELINEGIDPASITWIVFVHDYVYEPKDNDREHFCKTAETLGIKIELIENRIRFINYINAKAQNGFGKLREKTKIGYLSVFGHGQTPRFTGGDETQLSLAYSLNKSEENKYESRELEAMINFRQPEIEELDKNAFSSDVLTMFYTCNTGTADANGERFAQNWVNKVGGKAYAFQNARSNYIFINSTMDQISAAFNLPGPYDVAVSDIINKLREMSHDMLDGPSTELFTSILGENNRETAEYIAENIVSYPVSEEWKIK